MEKKSPKRVTDAKEKTKEIINKEIGRKANKKSNGRENYMAEVLPGKYIKVLLDNTYMLFFGTSSTILFSKGTMFFSNKKLASAAVAIKFQLNEQSRSLL